MPVTFQTGRIVFCQKNCNGKLQKLSVHYVDSKMTYYESSGT